MSILSIQACSNKGLERLSNEDMLSIKGELVRDSCLNRIQAVDDSGVYYYLVADGMGGHEKGEFTSEYTLKHISRNIDSMIDFENDFNAVSQWISRDLNKMSHEEGQTHPMGNTLSGIVWHKGKVWIVNVGDSRTYRLRSGLLKRLTVDQDLNHKYGTDMGEQGLALYNAIGGDCEGVVDVEDFTGKILDGDSILICSDGLTDMVDDGEIERIMVNEDGSCAEALVNKANNNGGKDNISVIVITIYDNECFPEELPEIIDSPEVPLSISTVEGKSLGNNDTLMRRLGRAVGKIINTIKK